MLKHVVPPLKADLHCHTMFSDGDLTPEELIDYATCPRKSIKVLAITDHDNMRACSRAQMYLSTHNLDLKLIPGIEVTTLWVCGSCPFQIHIVGLGCREDDLKLGVIIEKHAQLRQQQCEMISHKLIESTPVDPQALGNMIRSLQERGTFVTKKHFSDFLQQQGIVKNNDEAFERYLGKGAEAFFSLPFCSIGEAVDAIHSSGGVAVLAHPFRYTHMHKKVLRHLLEEFSQLGGDALEVGNSNQAIDEKICLRDLALHYDLYGSIGSDFHSPKIIYRSLGSDLWMLEKIKPIWEHDLIRPYFQLGD